MAASEEIASGLTAIAGFDIEQDLIQTPKLGSKGDFSSWRYLFQEIVQYAEQYSGLPWEKMPDQRLGRVRGLVRQVHRSMAAIQGFSPSNPGRETRESCAGDLQQKFESLLEEVNPHISYLWLDSINLDEHKRSLERTVAEGAESFDRLSAEYRKRNELLIADGQDSIHQLSSEIQNVKSETEVALKKVRAAAAEAGVSQQAATFHEAANRYESLAKRWLRGSIGSALATIGVGLLVVFVWNTVGDSGPIAFAQAVLGRTAVLAVLSYATVTAVRMYRSNSHLAVVNRHREDALKSFNAFREGTHSDDTKDKILLAAAHAAFGQTATGLIGEKADSGNTLEVFEGLFGRSVRGS